MPEYKVELSKTVVENDTISCEICTASVFADNEDEVKAMLRLEAPAYNIGKIEQLS